MPRASLNVPHLSWDQEPFLGNTNKNWNKYEEQNHHHWQKKKKNNNNNNNNPGSSHIR